MLVDTNAIHALGTLCSAQADHLAAAVEALQALPGPGSAAAFGPVGAGFLAALADAAAVAARAVAALRDDLTSAQSASGVVADAYTEADRRGGRLL